MKAPPIKIEILGTGGAFDPLSTAYLVNDHILIDCGVEIVKSLINDGRIAGIDTLIVTHLHQDHVGGLEALLYWKRFVAPSLDKPDESALSILAGPDFMFYYESLKCAYDNEGVYLQNFGFYEIHGNQWEPFVEIGELEVRFREGQHCFGSVPTYMVELMSLIGPRDPQDDDVLYEDFAAVLITSDSDRAAEITPDFFEEERTLCFHDMGWTGLKETEKRVHPTEQEVFDKFGKTDKIIGIHTSNPLQHYRMAKQGEVFYI